MNFRYSVGSCQILLQDIITNTMGLIVFNIRLQLMVVSTIDYFTSKLIIKKMFMLF